MIVDLDCVICGRHVRKRRSPANGGGRARFCSAECYNRSRVRVGEPRQQEPTWRFACEVCGQACEVYRSPTAVRPRFCSPQCTGLAQRGAANPSWGGGRREHPGGYIWLCVPDHPDHDVRGCVLEHRLVMEEAIGRRLRPEEVVHHWNRIRNDNRLDNLFLLPDQSTHLQVHLEDSCTL